MPRWFKVYIIESEAGWGQRVDEIKNFPSLKKATAFVKRYNRRYNPPGRTPSWYMYARMEGDHGYGMMR